MHYCNKCINPQVLWPFSKNEEPDFDCLPSAIIDSNGHILETNREFIKYFNYCEETTIRSLLDMRMIDNKISCYQHGYRWEMVYRSFGKNYKIWLIPKMPREPLIWDIMPIPLVLCNNEGLIISVNKKYIKVFGDISAGEFISVYSELTPTKFCHNAVIEAEWMHLKSKILLSSKQNYWLIVINPMDSNDNIYTIATMTTSVIHDFRNVLSVISGYCELIDQEQIYIPEYIEKIKSSTQTGIDMVSDLLKIIKSKPEKQQITNVSDYLINNNFKNIINTSIAIEKHFTHDICYVGLSESNLDRIISNLLSNANDAVGSGGQIKISLSKKFFKKSWTINDFYIKSGYHAEICVTDNGCGIPKKTLLSLFKKRITTKPDGNGIGLMSIAQILKQVSGGMLCFSVQNFGTRFVVYLPIVESLNKNIKHTSSSNINSQKSATIIFVEDNLSLQKVCAEYLQKNNHTVFSFSNAEDVIEFVKKPLNVDVLVTDANLPNKSGGFLAKYLKQIYKNLPIIVISGLDEEIIGESFPKDSVFIPKPVALANLIKEVHNLL